MCRVVTVIGRTSRHGRHTGLSRQADRIVDRHLEQDQDVFRRLLTTEDYFVYHNKDNEAGRKVIEEWTEVYHHFKGLDWKANPERVLEDNLDYLKTKKSVRFAGANQSATSCATCIFGGKRLAKVARHLPRRHLRTGTTTTIPSSTACRPRTLRYGGVENKNYKGLDDAEFWDYPVEQLFQINTQRPTHASGLAHRAFLQLPHRPHQARPLDSRKASGRPRARCANHR